jgi:hypothetical protein
MSAQRRNAVWQTADCARALRAEMPPSAMHQVNASTLNGAFRHAGERTMGRVGAQSLIPAMAQKLRVVVDLFS